MTAGLTNAFCAFRCHFAAAGNLRYEICVPAVQTDIEGLEIPCQLGFDRARALPANGVVD
jgi:hypothetical protein